jgi:hypothetical protein
MLIEIYDFTNGNVRLIELQQNRVLHSKDGYEICKFKKINEKNVIQMMTNIVQKNENSYLYVMKTIIERKNMLIQNENHG